MISKCQLWLVILYIFVATNTVSSQSCETPKREKGMCTRIDNCKELNDLFLNKKKMSKDDIKYLKGSLCGWQGRKPMVCCPFKDRGDLLPTKCGMETDDDRIFGGQVAGLRQFPWTALIEYENRYGGISTACGGSLISKRYVVTAAHCVTGAILTIVGRPVNVRLGEFDQLKEGKDCVPVAGGAEDCNDDPLVISIEKSIPHAQYEKTVTSKGDIALIRLAQNVEFTEFIRPICLPDSDRTDIETLKLVAAGWGATEKASFSPVKLFVSLPLVNCSKTNDPRSRAESTELCAGGVKNEDTCHGDSGGPLMDRIKLKYYLIGVTSRGPLPCGSLGQPGIYTKTFAFIDWIKSNLKP